METLGKFQGKDIRLYGEAPFSFEFPSNGILALIGNNGSGKTTFLKGILGERERIEGTFSGIGDNVAYVPQEHEFPFALTVWDLLMLAYLPKMGWFGSLPATAEREARAICEALGITKTQARLGEVSSGERQRVFLARAFLQRPSIILFDEPTNHLDPLGMSLFWSFLVRWQKETNALAVLSTHDLSFVEKDASHVLALNEGKPLLSGDVKAVLQPGWQQRVFGISGV